MKAKITNLSIKQMLYLLSGLNLRFRFCDIFIDQENNTIRITGIDEGGDIKDITEDLSSLDGLNPEDLV